jgi:two-component system, cell cycle sensor histidine kinase and response regulator CckA
VNVSDLPAMMRERDMNVNHNGNKSILIVEDQPMVANALKMILKIDGYDVVTAKNGPEALEMYQPGKFALVFTDYKMPEMTGHQVAASIRARDASQRIILVTAYSDLALHDNRSNNVNLVLEKPWSVEALRAAIAKVMSDGSGATES